MAVIDLTECFNVNIKFWRFLGVWPSDKNNIYYKYYATSFVFVFIILYDLLSTINFYFLPRQLDNFIEDFMFYFTEISVSSKVLTFFFMHDKIMEIFKMLQSDVFETKKHKMYVIENAKKFNNKCWKIVAIFSFTSNLTHVLSPLAMHLIFSVDLHLPLSTYAFLSESSIQTFIYPLYFYQAFGMHFQMLYNLNIDTFFWGIMVYVIAQLDVLGDDFRYLTNDINIKMIEQTQSRSTSRISLVSDRELIKEFNKTIVHHTKVSKFCALFQEVFSVTLFIQFSMASCIICICAFRCILPAPWQYYIFLGTYMAVMISQILVPCWYGTRVIDKSFALSHAIYSCDWTARSRQFKNSMRIFVERACSPITIIGWKMFPLSLKTFTSIINTAYSFFTLLRHMQTRQ